VAIRVKPHKVFSRENDNLYCQATISFARAAMGTQVEIPTFQGREILTVPAGTQPGEVLMIKGKGLRNVSNHRKGNLFVRIEVQTPRNMSRKQKQMLRTFAESQGEDLDKVEKSAVSRVKNLYH